MILNLKTNEVELQLYLTSSVAAITVLFAFSGQALPETATTELVAVVSTTARVQTTLPSLSSINALLDVNPTEIDITNSVDKCRFLIDSLLNFSSSLLHTIGFKRRSKM